MVNDMYAIYESYKQLREDRADLSGLSNGSNLTANINHTETKPQLSGGVSPTTDQGITAGDLGQDNEEVKVSKDILKLINSITRCAHKGDYSSIVVDCMHLSKLASARIKK
jgi:hypothetical protein